MMGKLHWCTSSLVHYHQMDGKLQACDSLEMLILNLPNSTLMTITTWRHPLMGYMRSHFWCMPMERYLTHIDNTRTHIWWVSSWSIIDKAYRTTWLHVAHSSCFMFDQTWIYSPLFVLVNLVSSHALSYYLDRWSWCQYTRYIIIFMASILESNTWNTSSTYGIFLHINSMKALVHRGCH